MNFLSKNLMDDFKSSMEEGKELEDIDNNYFRLQYPSLSSQQFSSINFAESGPMCWDIPPINPGHYSSNENADLNLIYGNPIIGDLHDFKNEEQILQNKNQSSNILFNKIINVSAVKEESSLIIERSENNQNSQNLILDTVESDYQMDIESVEEKNAKGILSQKSQEIKESLNENIKRGTYPKGKLEIPIPENKKSGNRLKLQQRNKKSLDSVEGTKSNNIYEDYRESINESGFSKSEKDFMSRKEVMEFNIQFFSKRQIDQRSNSPNLKFKSANKNFPKNFLEKIRTEFQDKYKLISEGGDKRMKEIALKQISFKQLLEKAEVIQAQNDIDSNLNLYFPANQSSTKDIILQTLLMDKGKSIIKPGNYLKELSANAKTLELATTPQDLYNWFIIRHLEEDCIEMLFKNSPQLKEENREDIINCYKKKGKEYLKFRGKK